MRDADERDAPPRLKPKRHKIIYRRQSPAQGADAFWKNRQKTARIPPVDSVNNSFFTAKITSGHPSGRIV